MPYEALVTRTEPTFIVFLLDQSTSMQQNWSVNSKDSKSNQVARIMNSFLHNLCIDSTKEDGVRDYFYISVLGYGSEINTAFNGNLEGEILVPISEIADNPVEFENEVEVIEDSEGVSFEKINQKPIWIKPVANGMTPMCEALNEAKKIVETWVDEHPNSYPPVVFNITDGEANDGEPLPIAEELKSISTSDGNVLLFNIHISANNGEITMFPEDVSDLNDKFATLLFDMSSHMPPTMQAIASNKGYLVSETSKGYGFNGDMKSVADIIKFGSTLAIEK